MIDYDNPYGLDEQTLMKLELYCSSFGRAHVLYGFVIQPLNTYDANTQKVSTIGAHSPNDSSAPPPIHTHTHTLLLPYYYLVE